MIVSFETIGNYVFALAYDKEGDYVTCKVYSAIVDSLLTSDGHIDMFNLVNFDGEQVSDFKDAFLLFSVNCFVVGKGILTPDLTLNDIATEVSFNQEYTMSDAELDAVQELIHDVIKHGSVDLLNGKELENQAVFNGQL